MRHIEDFSEHFINYFLEQAEEAVRRDHATHKEIPNFDRLVEEKMISMIEHIIEYAAKNTK